LVALRLYERSLFMMQSRTVLICRIDEWIGLLHALFRNPI
jgi:hypothetical protein